ncbi:MAG TPA: beta-ketoacyl synthase, partial [Flavobacteriaceae bacterium]|nr:beta-ketoacyl synthase [Flavobacteriaceae bacterium]
SSKGFSELGVSKNINIVKTNTPKRLNIFLKTASGFGGCNTAVIFKTTTNQP